MSEEETYSPTGGGSGGGFAIVGLLLVGGAAALLYMTQCNGDDETAEVEPVGAQQEPEAEEPARTQFQDTLMLPPEEPDAGVQDAGTANETARSTMRRGGMSTGAPATMHRCEGELARHEAAIVMRPFARQVRACYERSLRSNHGLQGRASVSITVGRTGRPSGVNVGGSIRDGAFRSCVSERARGLRFPAPSGDSCAVIRQGFNLTPSG